MLLKITAIAFRGFFPPKGNQTNKQKTSVIRKKKQLQKKQKKKTKRISEGISLELDFSNAVKFLTGSWCLRMLMAGLSSPTLVWVTALFINLFSCVEAFWKNGAQEDKL